MAASQVHLVRHGEVHNPDGILYGRMPGFHLSDLGRSMAQAAADDLVARRRPVAAVIASPLQRTQESAAPIAAAFDQQIQTDARLIEPANHFEGKVMSKALRSPANWPWLVNPLRPSWGESYHSIEQRMLAALHDAFDRAESATAQRSSADGDAAPVDVVLVSHQLPIWVAHLSLAGERFMHDPRERRCSLSSITTFERRSGQLVEVSYSDPAAALAADSTDVGAV
ncbi:histidine phosphatase family protein [Humibacter ginsenosidimutans]|uniref:Histidine phosphatase family protein n=1 Tax=Humibacter ginsenosidimutans TaxID=2599293 RepID=A0A5B8M9F3_9MICO|nr:histidine phosphatase family protein [Humibacter ginsenosidimutans]QDZ16070.1 histidine phosphatase family protein [Humibacter ginsenosidimutans]